MHGRDFSPQAYATSMKEISQNVFACRVGSDDRNCGSDRATSEPCPRTLARMLEGQVGVARGLVVMCGIFASRIEGKFDGADDEYLNLANQRLRTAPDALASAARPV